MEKLKKIPSLRFSEFDGEWENKKFSEIVKINQGLQIPISERYLQQVENSYFYITNEFLKQDSEKKYFVKNPNQSVICTKDDILMTRTGNTGMVVTNAEGVFHNNFFKVAYPEYIDKTFLYNFLKLENTQNLIKKMAGTSTIPDLNHSDFYRIKLAYPTKTEQTKIASFLTAVEDKLQALKQKKTLLEQYKKGVMQKIFSQELRFKDDNGNDYPDWEEKKLGEVLFEHLEKNKEGLISEVFSVAKHKGVINQIEHLGRSFSAKEIFHYKLTFPNDIVYTKSPTSDFPFGIIKQNLTGRTGVVSPLYGVFKPLTPELGFILHNYFDSWKNVFNYLNPLVQKGAKNTMNINNKDFLNGAEILLPISNAEQTKIANFLSAIDDKINHCQAQIEKTEVWKKGLLQQMFV